MESHLADFSSSPTVAHCSIVKGILVHPSTKILPYLLVHPISRTGSAHILRCIFVCATCPLIRTFYLVGRQQI